MNSEFLLRRLSLGALGAFAFAACGVSEPSVGMLGGNPSDGQGDGVRGDGDEVIGDGDWSLHDGSDTIADGCGDCYSDGSGDGFDEGYNDGSGDGFDEGYGEGSSFGDGFGGDGVGSSVLDASVDPTWPPDAGDTD